MSTSPENAGKSFQVIEQGGNRIAVIDPTKIVDGHPQEVATFDLNHPREFDQFIARLVVPALIAAGYKVSDIFLNAEEDQTEDSHD